MQSRLEVPDVEFRVIDGEGREQASPTDGDTDSESNTLPVNPLRLVALTSTTGEVPTGITTADLPTESPKSTK